MIDLSRYNLLFLLILLSCSSAEDVTRPGDVRLQMKTSLGTIEIEVDVAAAPVTAKNFLRLADNGHLDGGTFYRTVSPDNDKGSPVISVIQGGIFDAEGPFPPIVHETTKDTGLLHVDGAISMARAAVGTATTEFFICVGDQPGLDYGAMRNPDKQGFAVFGRVVKGMDVVKAIHDQPSDAPTESDYMRGQIIEEPVGIISVRRVVSRASE